MHLNRRHRPSIWIPLIWISTVFSFWFKIWTFWFKVEGGGYIPFVHWSILKWVEPLNSTCFGKWDRNASRQTWSYTVHKFLRILHRPKAGICCFLLLVTKNLIVLFLLQLLKILKSGIKFSCWNFFGGLSKKATCLRGRVAEWLFGRNYWTFLWTFL